MYGFGRELVALSESERIVRADAEVTRLGQALEQLPAKFADTLPFGLFVFSDGPRPNQTQSRRSGRLIEPWACRSMGAHG